MRKDSGHEERESKLASGWTVHAEAPNTPDAPDAEASISQVSAQQPAEGAADAAATSAAAAASAVVPGDSSVDAGSEPATKQLSNVALVVLGVIGGLYLLYTLVWFSWAQYYADTNTLVAEGSGSIGFVLQQLTYWVAPLAPALWFFSALFLNRGKATWRVALWLLIGAVVLVPLPMFSSFGGA